MEKGQKRAKKSKIFENLGKNIQNLKIFWKKTGDYVRLSHATARKGPGSKSMNFIFNVN